MRSILFFISLYALSLPVFSLDESQATANTKNGVAKKSVVSSQQLIEIAECHGALEFGSIAAKADLSKAPSYAKEKYENRFDFYKKGERNLLVRAHDDPSFNEDEFYKISDAKTDEIHESIKTTQQGDMVTLSNVTSMLNSIMSMCTSMAGLSAEDFPR